MDKLLRDSLTVHLENFGYENIPKLENIIPKLKDYNETISSINYMLSIPRFKLGMSDEMYENWRESQYGGFTKPYTRPETKEDKEMISAKEAKAIADDNNKDFDITINTISSKIIKAAESGLYHCSYIFYIDSYVYKNMHKIQDALEKEGYDVYITRVDPFSACFTRFEFNIYWEENKNDKC